MHKVFTSYHHENDQFYKDELIRVGSDFGIFIDKSVDTGDIDETLSDQRIREIIRDEYLRDSTVTILLVGTETMCRKHIDWEIYSSMFDGRVNKKSGILVINLPSTNCDGLTAAHGAKEKNLLYPEVSSWTNFTRREYERCYPYVPDRIIDSLVASDALISVVPWNRISPSSLKTLIDLTFEDRISCKYDLSRRLKRRNY